MKTGWTIVAASCILVLLLPLGCSFSSIDPGNSKPVLMPAPIQPPSGPPSPKNSRLNQTSLPEPVLDPILKIITGSQDLDIPPGFWQHNLQPSLLEASSVFQNFNEEALIRETSFWHVYVPRESSQEWLTIDIGAPQHLAAISVKPRPDSPDQLWRKDGAIIQASDDGVEWNDLLTLRLYIETIEPDKWIIFMLPEDLEAYRHYRLLITSPEFISLAGLRIYIS